jgi:hypothetical protein
MEVSGGGKQHVSGHINTSNPHREQGHEPEGSETSRQVILTLLQIRDRAQSRKMKVGVEHRGPTVVHHPNVVPGVHKSSPKAVL